MLLRCTVLVRRWTGRSAVLRLPITTRTARWGRGAPLLLRRGSAVLRLLLSVHGGITTGEYGLVLLCKEGGGLTKEDECSLELYS